MLANPMALAGKANFYFLDDKAYTEDDVLVYNIVAYQLPSKITKAELFKHFNAIGDVRSIHLREYPEPPIAYIDYAQPVAAARALERTHELQRKRIAVRACESWEQPGALRYGVDETGTIAGMIDLISFTSIGPHILDLTDDCLENICRQLSLRDQVRFARVCQRFRTIFQTVSLKEYQVLHLSELIGMTLWDIRDFFDMSGRNIRELIGSLPYNYQDRMDFISYFCPNVCVMDLNCNNMEPGSLMRLLVKMSGIKVLVLRNFSLSDSVASTLTNMVSLRVLKLEHCTELTGKHLKHLNLLQDLSLYGCENLRTEHFIEICQSIEKLQSLDIRHCKRLKTRAYSIMPVYCRHLKLLKMTCEKDVRYENVARIPSLLHLEIHSRHTISDEFFRCLSERKAPDLQHLELLARNCLTYERAIRITKLDQLKCLICPFNENLDDECLFEFGQHLQNLLTLDVRGCRNITNVGLLVILRRCERLTSINVEQCELITDEFALDAIDVLKQRITKEPIVLNVAGTAIHECVVNDLKSTYAGKWLKFNFTETNLP